MLLSVIVPVYNAGPYLRPCIKSLLSLPYDMEIIVVDDGSTDGAVEDLGISSEELGIDSVSMINHQLSVVTQRNQGVSAARNAGLKIAQGDWIWFVDSDDVVTELKTEKLKTESGSICPPADASLLLLPYIWEENGVAKPFEAADGDIPYNLWRCWFRRDCLAKNNLKFTVGRKYAEDQEFILQYLLRFPVINTKALEDPIYHYTMRASGAMMRMGVKWKKRFDLWCVLCSFVLQSIAKGQIAELWVRKQIKRLTKNLIII